MPLHTSPINICIMYSKPILTLLTLLLSVVYTNAQIDKAAVDKYFQQAQQDWKIPGMAIGIIQDGEIVLAKGYGTLAHNQSTPVDEHSLFAIASNTKAFVATAIGMLVEEEKLSWDDKVVDILPYFQLYDNYVTQHTTVEDVLCHRVGLGTFSGDEIWYKSEYSAQEVIKKAALLPPAYDFRDGYGYSNIMFFVAGEIIEAVSGQTWAEYIQTHILTPLDMQRTQTSIVPLAQMKNVASPHKANFKGVGENPQTIPWVNWDNMGAAGGIISSVDDMLKWLQLQINHGQWNDKNIFKPNTQIKLWTPHNSFPVSNRTKETYPTRHISAYGLGWGIADDGGHMIYSHGGGYDGMYSKVMVMPEQKFAMVVLTNSMKGISNNLVNYVLDDYFNRPQQDWSQRGIEREKEGRANRLKAITDRQTKRLKNTQPSLALSSYTGTYHDPLFGDILIKEKDNQLQLEFPKAPALNASLQHWHLDVFEIKWNEVHAWFDFGTLRFVLDNNAEIEGIEFDVPNRDIWWHEIHAKKQE